MATKRKSSQNTAKAQLKKLKERQRALDKKFREREQQLKKQRAAAKKKFRSDVAKLKKRSLVSKKIDARRVNPTRALKRAIKTFDDVITGTARVFKIGAKKAAEYARMGYRVKRGRVALPKASGGYVPSRGRDRGLIKETRQVGEGPRVTKTIVPTNIHNIDDWLQAQRERPSLREGESYGIRFFGWNLGQSFHDIDDLIDWFEHYHSIEDTRRSKDQTEVIANIEIVKIGSKQQIAWSKKIAKQRALVKEAKRATYNKARKENRKPQKLNEHQKAKKRAYDREYARRTYDTFKNTIKKRAWRKKQTEKKK
jgi:hypothetical protein